MLLQRHTRNKVKPTKSRKENANSIHKQVISFHMYRQNNLCVIVEDWLPGYDPRSQKATLIKIDFNMGLFI